MINRIKAWIEILKLGKDALKLTKTNIFLRADIISALMNEGWFDFFDQPHSTQELMDHFEYRDLDFTQMILDSLVTDRSLKSIGELYQTIRPINKTTFYPSFVNETIREIWATYAKAIPNRLRGKYMDFTADMNLFDWDDALGSKVYNCIRHSAFAFTDIFNKKGKFLDLGCGNGFGTTDIWATYFKNGSFYEGTPLEIIGLDIDKSLLKIAEKEFEYRLSKYFKFSNDFEKYAKFYPKFIEGTILKIPYENNYFDTIYISQVLQWSDPEKAIKEMIRVIKPGGIIFGTQSMYPYINQWLHFHTQVVKDAHGFFHKKEFINWAKSAGAKKIDIVTPIVTFKIKK